GDRLVVGRFDPSTGPVDIDLSGQQGSEHISRRHAELYLENGRWAVRDLGSTNGVYVKAAAAGSYGPRIQAPHVLSDGDEIAFGNTKFLYRDGPDADQAGAPAGNA
ncbi:MAG TPA: FHA domain-containing protein, partial [Deinococcales bacterium]|nr:FHA domain-containing protein [Deinococcales bacterium]